MEIVDERPTPGPPVPLEQLTVGTSFEIEGDEQYTLYIKSDQINRSQEYGCVQLSDGVMTFWEGGTMVTPINSKVVVY